MQAYFDPLPEPRGFPFRFLPPSVFVNKGGLPFSPLRHLGLLDMHLPYAVSRNEFLFGDVPIMIKIHFILQEAAK